MEKERFIGTYGEKKNRKSEQEKSLPLPELKNKGIILRTLRIRGNFKEPPLEFRMAVLEVTSRVRNPNYNKHVDGHLMGRNLQGLLIENLDCYEYSFSTSRSNATNDLLLCHECFMIPYFHMHRTFKVKRDKCIHILYGRLAEYTFKPIILYSMNVWVLSKSCSLEPHVS